MVRWMEDVRYALRSLSRWPGLTTAALLTLGVGIGANTAVFSVAERLVAQSLPYRDPDRLVYVGEQGPHFETAPRDHVFRAWREKAQTVEDMVAYGIGTFDLTEAEEAMEANGARVTPGFLDFLGLVPALGRTLAPGGSDADASGTVVLSHGLWQSLFGGDRLVLGRLLRIDSESYEVVGVLPEDFHFVEEPSVRFWIPFDKDSEAPIFRVMARLREGTTAEAAQAELSAIVEGIQPGQKALLSDPRDFQGGSGKTAVASLWIVTWFVLLIACANVASLLLARGEVRSYELVIRATLGAGRGRLMLQLLTESLILAFLGGALGLLLALWVSDAILPLVPESLGYLDVGTLNTRRLAFTVLVSLGTGILCGLLPSLQGSMPDLSRALKQHVSAGSSRRRILLRQGLVATEVALSFVLLLGILLLADQVRRWRSTDPGFRTDHLWSLRMELPEDRYGDRERQLAFYDAVLDSVSGRELGAGDAVSLGSGISVEGLSNLGARPEPDCRPNAGDDQILTKIDVAPGYFQILELPLRDGRGVVDADRFASEEPIVINATFADRYWPGSNPVGRRLGLPPWGCYRIVGVARDAHHLLGPGGNELQIYLPHWVFNSASRSLVVRSEVTGPALLESLKTQVSVLDPDVSFEIAAADDLLVPPWMADALRQVLLMALFAMLAVFLTAVGIYGIVTYSVSRQREEIGIRMTLGAERLHVLRSVLLTSMGPVAVGLGMGALGVFALGQVLENTFFGMEVRQPLVFAVTAIAVLLLAAVAAWIPARKATRLDPVTVLRQE